MADRKAVSRILSGLLNHHEALEKIESIRAGVVEEKAAVDGQLQIGLKAQQDITQSGMGSINDGQYLITAIQEEMVHLDRLCSESQSLVEDFPKINAVAQIHRNFESVQKIKSETLTIDRKIAELKDMLSADEEDMTSQPNLLPIHFNLTNLRNFRDDVNDQRKRDEKAVSELINNLRLPSGQTVQSQFDELDKVIEVFDHHIHGTCKNLIPHLLNGHDDLVVRIAIIIEEEEKCDLRTKAILDAQRDYKELTSRFKSISSGARELRGYKERFLETIEERFNQEIPTLMTKFTDKPDKLSKALSWYFDDLHIVKTQMVPLMPKKWRIFHTYVEIYHRLLHDWLISCLDSDSRTAVWMLAIIKYPDVYYRKMRKLGAPEEAYQLPLIDDRTPALINEYRQLITSSVTEWMDRIINNDIVMFRDRLQCEPVKDSRDLYRTKTMSDMWQMLHQQLKVAAHAEREDVAEGVVEYMVRALGSRQQKWEEVLSAELATYVNTGRIDMLLEFQMFLIAIANDQIVCIERTESNPTSSLDAFADASRELVSERYREALDEHINALRSRYLDLSTFCLKKYVDSIFATDLAQVLKEVFTKTWYENPICPAILETFKDYLSEHMQVCHPLLQDFLVEALFDELLVRYLGAVGNAGVVCKDLHEFTSQIRLDIGPVLEYLSDGSELHTGIKGRWEVVKLFVDLLWVARDRLADSLRSFLKTYPDTSIVWVEAVIRMRPDKKDSMLTTVREVAREVPTARDETIMGRVTLSR